MKNIEYCASNYVKIYMRIEKNSKPPGRLKLCEDLLEQMINAKYYSAVFKMLIGLTTTAMIPFSSKLFLSKNKDKIEYFLKLAKKN